MKKSYRKATKKMAMMLIVSGFLWARTDVIVQAEEYIYDDLNRVTKVIYEDGSFVEYTYDHNGNITSVEVHDAAPGQKPDSGNNEGGTDENEKNPENEENTTSDNEKPSENENASDKEETSGNGDTSEGEAPTDKEESSGNGDTSEGENPTDKEETSGNGEPTDKEESSGNGTLPGDEVTDGNTTEGTMGNPADDSTDSPAEDEQGFWEKLFYTIIGFAEDIRNTVVGWVQKWIGKILN